MTTNANSAEKSIVAQLDFDAKTAKRVAWSQWEFTIVAPFEIEVCNASYGHLKDEHTYRVMIDDQGVPISCDCPGFQHYHGPNDRVGKHMLAVAAIGGWTLLDAAAAFSPDTNVVPETVSETAAEKLKPDGGDVSPDTEPEPETCPNGDPRCGGPNGDDLSCFECFDPTAV
jgi:hypothetical protein